MMRIHSGTNRRIAYADGTISENVYKAKLAQLRKQGAELVERKRNLNPSELSEVSEVSQRIHDIREILHKGKLQLTDLGFFASAGNQYIPVGFNPWPGNDGKMSVGRDGNSAQR